MTRLRRNENTAAKIDDALVRLESLRDRTSGKLIVEHAPAEIRDKTNAWAINDNVYRIMHRIKEQLDPGGVFPSL